MNIATVLTLFSVLIPVKVWFAADQPVSVTVKSDGPVTLVLTDFTGKPLETKADTTVAANQRVDVRALYPAVNNAGTYVLFAVPQGQAFPAFVGTPLVIESRADKRPGAPPEPMVTKVEPLSYAVMSTDQGDMTLVFYYDAAPHTTASFLRLSTQGFYDGLTFHRIVPNFVVQGGDPRGTGTGGPGFHLDAEFSDRRHEEGVLSMARNGDPLEAQGLKPRPEFANSAGSQFFICLGRTEHLDGRYTAFGRVVEGMDTVRALGRTPVADARTGRPEKAPVIKSVSVHPVTPANNPYTAIMEGLKRAANSQPAP